MTAQVPDRRTLTGERIDRLAGSVDSYLSRRAGWAFFAASIWFFVTVILRARGTPFWLDEILTLLNADLPSAAAVAKEVLNGGGDLMPPACHLAIHWSDATFGTGEVASRIPGTIGFWIFCACIFRFVTRRAGICYGLAAMLLPAATESFRHAFEARSYGLLLGCAGAAVLCWQAAARGERRNWTLPGLALSLAAGVLTHYYAVLVLVPLAAAELHRAFVRRRFDRPMWLAILAGLAPLAVLAPFVLKTISGVAAAGSAHNWSSPSVQQYVEYYPVEFAHMLVPLVLLSACTGLYAALGGKYERAVVEGEIVTSSCEWTLAVVFLSVPLMVITSALLVTHSFTPRYAIVGITGFLILAPLTLHAATRGRAAVGLFLLAASAAQFATQTAAGMRAFAPSMDHEPLLRKALAQSDAVVLTDGLLFVKLWYYLPADQKGRLVYLADPELAASRGGWSQLDSGLLDLRRLHSINVLDYRSFTSTRREFLIYFDADRPAWQMSQILAAGGAIEIIERTEERALLRARMKQ